VSYDLFFRSRSPESLFSRDEFVHYFTGRASYQVKDSQAWYSNEDSGVYFVFEWNARGDDREEGEETDPSLIPVAFNMNYFRPHPFGLEAESEVAAFVQNFDLTVSDPQMSGMGDGEYSADGFLRGWNRGNAFAYQAFLSQDSEQEYLTLPESQIESLWRWNSKRKQRQEKLGEAVFVPRIFFFAAGGEVQTGIVWADGIPIFLPVVDLVLAPRDRLAPRRWLRSKEDIVEFRWREIEPIAKRFRKSSSQPEACELFYQEIPADIERAIREKAPLKEVPQAVAFDQILDLELIEEARGKLTNENKT
jgi:hypothetical protein